MSSLPPTHLAQSKQLRGRLDGPVTAAQAVRKFEATVTAVSAGPPKTVTIQQGALSEFSGIRYDASLTPTVGMKVWGLAVDGDYQVCGTLA